MGGKGLKTQKITCFEAKYDFQAIKIHTLVVETIWYLRDSIGSIVWTKVRLNWPSIAKERATNWQKVVNNSKFPIFKLNMILKCPQTIVW